VIRPFQEIFRLYEAVLRTGPVGRAAVRLFAGLAIGWWIYVPLHELLHAAGCLLGGGVVERLEIHTLYGGGPLARLLPFVTAGGSYAGRLSGFDTCGSDMVYGLTVAFPFLLSLLGLAGLRWSARANSPLRFGLLLPLALAPLVSLTGDYYELGALLLFQLWPGPHGIYRILISDDIFRLGSELCAGTLGLEPSPFPKLFLALSQLLGAVLVLGTFLLSGLLDRFIWRNRMAGGLPS